MKWERNSSLRNAKHKARGLRAGENPAAWRGHLNALLPTISKKRRVKHYEAMDWWSVPAFMAQLRQRANMSSWALQFTILTTLRTGTIIGTPWSEIDLPRQAVELLQAMPRLEGSELPPPHHTETG